MKLMIPSAAFASLVSPVPTALSRHIQASDSVPDFLAASSHGDRQTLLRDVGYLCNWVSLGAGSAGLG